MTQDEIARIGSEVNRAYCEAIGDPAGAPWALASEGARNSARLGVGMHLLRDVGPECAHEAWMEHKLKEGWVLGPVKDEAKKEHPLLVRYDQLPSLQQAKDYIFRAIVHSLRDLAANPEDPRPDLKAAALVLKGQHVERISFWASDDWRAPKGFPRKELLCVPAQGGKTWSVKVDKLLAFMGVKA